jgi:hypothetical protein
VTIESRKSTVGRLYLLWNATPTSDWLLLQRWWRWSPPTTIHTCENKFTQCSIATRSLSALFRHLIGLFFLCFLLLLPQYFSCFLTFATSRAFPKQLL